MSYAEQQDWLLYIRENGPINPYLRLEAAIGRAVLPFLKKGTKLVDLMPWLKSPDEGTAEEVSQVLMAALRSGGGSGRKARYKVRKNGQ